MQQGRLYPLQIVRTEPAPFQRASCRLIGKGDDGLTYYLKRVSDGPLVPISDYVGTMLASAVGLAVANCHIALMPDRVEHCFASRQEGGVEDGSTFLATMANQSALLQLGAQLIRWYTYDLFIRNVDHHPDNFLFFRTDSGVAMFGIDFGQALLAQDWPGAHPPLPLCHTTRTFGFLHRNAPFPREHALPLLNQLQAIPDDWLRRCLADAPAEWLDAKLTADVCRWWRHGRAKRLRQLRTHLSNGRYLQLLDHPRRAGPAPGRVGEHGRGRVPA